MTLPLNNWQQALREAYRDPLDLLRDLGIAPDAIDWLAPDSNEFAIRVPRSFAARMRPGDARDPLLLQVLPRRLERQGADGFVADPLQEADFRRAPGLIQKYQGRALLVTTGACGVHCRYCFRREFPYADYGHGPDSWQTALATLAEDRSIEELILSGGDPLSLSDDRLGRLLAAASHLPQLRRLRLHTRQPVVLPERITPTLVELLGQARPQKLVIVLHVNHAQELQGDALQALASLQKTGATLLNQSVLLAGINDDARTLATLSQSLFDQNILPYYLHQLDPVRGAAHFSVADERARGIMAELNALLPGYLVPRLVREVPGAGGKLPLPWSG